MKLFEANRYQELIKVTEKFHTTLDKDVVLDEVLLAFQEILPLYSNFLLLTHDHYSKSELPIIDPEYENENITAINAFVSGNIQMEESFAENRSILYAPLKGKQGVYGVMQIIASDTLNFPESDIELIALLANSAGNALENAHRYQKSLQEINNLQIINETSHRLNSNLRLAETMTYMSKQMKQCFAAQEVGFFLLTENQGRPKVLPGSTAFFFSKQAKLYVDYIIGKIQTDNKSLFIGDLNLPTIEDMVNFHSIMAIPMIQSQILKGFSIVMHQKAFFFSFDNFKLMQSLIHHSSLALTNSMLREELERMIITDHLTKLHSRNYLDEKIQRSMKEDEEGTFILIDLDNFKDLNDTYGHQVGDNVLIQVANLIKANIRGNDVGARWGGEELAIYLPKVSMEAGVSIAKRLVEKIADCSNPTITVSCGVSYWNKDRLDTYNYLFKRADDALYIAKGTGKNRVVTQIDSIRAS
jgi:diguanylate cyclase (GGDEF)-like protein